MGGAVGKKVHMPYWPLPQPPNFGRCPFCASNDVVTNKLARGSLTCQNSATKCRHPTSMGLRFNRFVRRLTALLAAIAFVFAAVAPGLSAAHAAGSASLCAAFIDASAQSDSPQDHAFVLGHKSAAVDQSGLDNPYQKTDGNAKSPCCSSFCSPTVFSLSENELDTSVTVKSDDWPMTIHILTSADTDSLKRPPRGASGKFARA